MLILNKRRDPLPPDAPPPPITRFSGEWRFLSNFYPVPLVDGNGTVFDSVEHAYQAYKSADRSTDAQFAGITAAAAKALGRRLPLRRDWDTYKLRLMKALVMQKFSRHPALRERLLATEDRPLIEGNTWNDTFWGVCRGHGHNHLGRILMEVRETLKGREQC